MDASGGANRAQRIQELMDSQGWGKSYLARLLRTDHTRVHAWLDGGNISDENLERLAVALETTMLYLESGQGPKHYPRGSTPALLLKDLVAAQEELKPPKKPADPE